MRILLMTVVLGVVLGFLGRTKSLNLIPKIQRRNNFALAVAVAPNPMVDSTCKLPEIEDTCTSGERATNFLEIEESNEAFTAPLLEDIEKLSGILGAVIKSENKKAFDLYEAFKAHALARTNLDDKEALGRMINCAVKISPDDALSVIRAFTQTLNLVNSAEVYHRLRLLRNADIKSQSVSPLPMREDSVAGTIKTLLTKANKQEVFDALLVQKVDIVLTAHPTEVNRRTLLRKYREISETLAALDRKDLSAYEKSVSEEGLRREIFSIWGSDEIRREKPTPQTEAAGGLAIVETVLWDAVPCYLRKLNAQCIESLDRPIPLDLVPIQFSSWMGGDRDGNPNVTPKVTYEVSTTNRLQAARLILADILTLYNELAICKGFSPDMLALAAEVKQSSDKRELYRRVLGHLSKRLLATIKWCENELEHADSAGGNSDPTLGGRRREYLQRDAPDGEKDLIEPIFDAVELTKSLTIMHSSLVGGGYGDVADGYLVDLIRRIATFGLTLVPLDLRQESTRHTGAVDAITQYLGLGSYKSWDESTRIAFIQAELVGKRPLIRISDIDDMGFDPLVLDVLKTIQVAASLGPGSFGAYVISQATCASDVMAVMLLQKQFGLTTDNGKMLRVVPLFETLTDLNNASDVCETLFTLPGYLEAIKGKQEIMVGYSDSAKDAGRLAACWAQYESQEKMVKVALKYGVELTFFHGKGGTVGRGGNPALYRAVLAHPPQTINGKFRVTEQGEMITQNFGSEGIAERTLDIYTAAVLAEKFVTHVDPKPHWRARMDALSESSCASYRTAITEEHFVKYFRAATPELELGSLNIGSRPAKRNPTGGIESLRAIPWQFAWTQTRLNLPAWLGVGEGLDDQGDCVVEGELREMYMQWPFFREMIDLIAMTLSKTDYSISTNYENQLCDPSNKELAAVGVEMRRRLIVTRNNVQKVTKSEDFSNGFALLKVSMKVRNPYVDPLNVLQAEIMKRLRQKDNNNLSKEDRMTLEDALVVSVNGIAQGMKNSG